MDNINNFCSFQKAILQVSIPMLKYKRHTCTPGYGSPDKVHKCTYRELEKKASSPFIKSIKQNKKNQKHTHKKI